MKKILSVYFDYICPYCYRGITNLLELLPAYPELSTDWIPCEAHPKPEMAFIHSDLASQALLAAARHGGNLLKFHQDIFTAHFVEHRRIDNLSVLAGIASDCGADQDRVLADLKNGLYRQAVLDNNRLVWNTLNFEAVPCYQCEGKLLASHEDVMISREQLKSFLDSITA